MKQFNKTIVRAGYGTLLEADEFTLPGDEMGAAAPVTDEVGSSPGIDGDDVDNQVEVDVLSPEAEVVLVRFVRKALVIDLSLDDKANLLSSVPDESEIDENNAKETLEILQTVISSYTSSSDDSVEREQLNIPI